MYFLRKVHKSPHQLRPIVSCCSGPTQKLSQLANNLLRDYLHSVPSLIASSTQVIKVIESLTVPIDSRKQLFLATLDVKALYPSIPQALGVNFALQQALPTDPLTSTSHPLKNMLKEMLLHVIRHNTFEFAKKNFRQIRGVAMGTPVAPTLANLFMGKVEFDALNAWPGTQPIVWLRYIDDILLLLEDTDDCLTELLAHLNGRVSSIKFTKESSTQSIDFLDLTIFKGPRFESQGILDIRPYCKLIDPHAYLHFSSGHHRSVLVGLVRGEYVRALRRSSSAQIYASAIAELQIWFKDRGYSRDILRTAADSIKYTDRQELLKHSSNRSLPDCTTILSVKNHPAIKSSAIRERHLQMWNYPSNQSLPERHRPPMLRCSSKLPRPQWKKHTDTTSEGERHSQQKNFYNSKPHNLLTHSLLILLVQSPLHIHFLNMAPPAYRGSSHGASPLRPPRPCSM